MASNDNSMDPMFTLPPKTEVPTSKLSEARDLGTQTREFHAWTMRKLEVLSAYFRMYRRVAGSGTYLDAFAGSGHAMIGGKRTEGSALRAIESGAFRDHFLIEMDPPTHAQLGEALDSLPKKNRDKVHLQDPKDCNRLIPHLLQEQAIDRGRPCFALLDPDSTELDWATVEALARYKEYVPPPAGSRSPEGCKVELWILVNTHQALQRLLPADRRKHEVPPHAHVLDRVMGGRDAWWDLWADGWGGPDRLAHRYADRLRIDLGYRFVHAQRVHDPGTNRSQYYMVHASDHPNAHSLMRTAKRERFDDPPQFRGMRSS